MTKTYLKIANLLLVFLVPLTSALPSITGLGRSIGDQSARNDTVLVPYEFAFSIWGPIFIGLIAYGFYQLAQRSGLDTIRRDTALAFLATCLWSLAASFAPNSISTILTSSLFVAIVYFALNATFKLVSFSQHAPFLKSSQFRWLALIPISAYAAWCSLAIFINWAQLFIVGPINLPFSQVAIGLIILLVATGFLAWAVNATQGLFSFYFPLAWGLLLLCYARLLVDDHSVIIAAASFIAALVLTAVMLYARKRR